MLRTLLCTVALFGFGAVASAGELDKEAGPKSTAPTLTASVPATTAPAGSELDKESPQPAYHWHGGWGHHHGWGGWGGGWGGYRGFGYGGFGYGGWGGYRGFGWGGFYRPYYSGFYGGFYRPYYGWGYPGLGYSSFSIGFGRGLGWYW